MPTQNTHFKPVAVHGLLPVEQFRSVAELEIERNTWRASAIWGWCSVIVLILALGIVIYIR